jgi:transcriptional regulator with XRE-family HTH domain
MIYTDGDLPTVLRACRQREGQTQAELARALDRYRGRGLMGQPNRRVTAAMVSAWERGTARPQWRELCLMADWLAAPELLYTDRGLRQELATETGRQQIHQREAALAA